MLVDELVTDPSQRTKPTFERPLKERLVVIPTLILKDVIRKVAIGDVEVANKIKSIVPSRVNFRSVIEPSGERCAMLASPVTMNTRRSIGCHVETKNLTCRDWVYMSPGDYSQIEKYVSQIDYDLILTMHESSLKHAEEQRRPCQVL